MSDLRFERDPAKARSNERKHGVSVDEASTAFADEEGLLLDDPDHSENEDRFILLGLSSSLRLLVVVHRLREEGNVIRIISARKADRAEADQYLERLRR